MHFPLTLWPDISHVGRLLRLSDFAKNANADHTTLLTPWRYAFTCYSSFISFPVISCDYYVSFLGPFQIISPSSRNADAISPFSIKLNVESFLILHILTKGQMLRLGSDRDQ
jgi:hypothetical protein